MAPRRRRRRSQLPTLTVMHPDRLWCWAEALYLDENERPWVPMYLENEGDSVQILMRQQDVPLGRPLSYSEMPPFPLPVMCQLHLGGVYRGVDSSFWRILYHTQFNGMEDMLLELIPGTRPA